MATLPPQAPPPSPADAPLQQHRRAIQQLAEVVARQQATIDRLEAALTALSAHLTDDGPVTTNPDRARQNRQERRVRALDHRFDAVEERLAALDERLEALAAAPRHEAPPEAVFEDAELPRAEPPPPRPRASGILGLFAETFRGGATETEEVPAAHETASAVDEAPRPFPAATAVQVGDAFVAWCRQRAASRAYPPQLFERHLRHAIGEGTTVTGIKRRYDSADPVYDEASRTGSAYWLVRAGEEAFLLPWPTQSGYQDLHPDSFVFTPPAPPPGELEQCQAARLRASGDTWAIAAKGALR